MQYKQLGKTDLNVSVIGFGSGPLGNLYGDIDTQTGINAVHAAIDGGVNFFDTAYYYGPKLSEIRLGEALKGYRDKVLIATKGGRYDDAEFDFTAKRLTEAIEESLTRLQTDYIDLYQLHDIEFDKTSIVLEEGLPILEKFREQGKIRYIGITGYPPHLLRDVAQQHPVDSILSYCHYNLMNTTLNEVLVPTIEEQGIGLINASILHMGVLTEKGAQPWHPAPQKVHDAGKQIAQLAHEHGANITDLAIQFALQNEHVDTTLIGMRTIDEVEHNLALLDSEIDTALLAKIQEVIAPVKDINWVSGLPEHHEPGALPQRNTSQ